MAFNGLGTFTPVSPPYPAIAGTLINAADWNTAMLDLAAGLSMCITIDGQNTVTADIPFNGHKLTGVGNGSAAADAVTFGQVFSSPSFTGGITVAGGAVIAGGLTLTGGGTATGTLNFSGATAITAPTVATADNSTNVATTAYVTAKAFSAALPAQSAATKGEVPMSDGTNAAWTPLPGNNLFMYSNLGGF